MYKRVFTFGCSFTKFPWPTWADIISDDLQISGYNYGLNGIGNVGIANRMLQADLRHSFTEEDLILVVWTGWTREDRFDKQWIAAGNVYNNSHYDKTFLEQHWRISDCIIKNSNAIITSNKLFNINFQGHMNKFSTNYLSDDEKIWYDFYNRFLSWDNIFEEKGIYSEYHYNDHPSIASHIEYVNQKIYPTLNLTLKNSTVAKFMELHEKLEKIENLTQLKLQLKELWKQPDNIL